MVQCFARELRLSFYFFVQSCVCLLHSFDVPKHFFIFRKFIGLHLFIIFRCHVFQMCSSMSGLLMCKMSGMKKMLTMIDHLHSVKNWNVDFSNIPHESHWLLGYKKTLGVIEHHDDKRAGSRSARRALRRAGRRAGCSLPQTS